MYFSVVALPARNVPRLVVDASMLVLAIGKVDVVFVLHISVGEIKFYGGVVFFGGPFLGRFLVYP